VALFSVGVNTFPSLPSGLGEASGSEQVRKGVQYGGFCKNISVRRNRKSPTVCPQGPAKCNTMAASQPERNEMSRPAHAGRTVLHPMGYVTSHLHASDGLHTLINCVHLWNVALK